MGCTKLRDAGADKVWLQEVMIPVWVRGKESLHIKTSGGNWKNLKMLSLGNSEGTGGKDVSGEIIMVKSLEEYDKLPAEKVKIKSYSSIILLTRNIYRLLFLTGKQAPIDVPQLL
jgi:hypothetical protein